MTKLCKGLVQFKGFRLNLIFNSGSGTSCRYGILFLFMGIKVTMETVVKCTKYISEKLLNYKE